MSIKEQVIAIGREFSEGLQEILEKKLYGAYFYGAAAFPDNVPTGDIDFHVILTGNLTDEERNRLYDLHDALSCHHPPLGSEMDGYYILLADARKKEPPQSQMWQRAIDHSWALHRKHIRKGRYILLSGPDPVTIYPPATWSEIEIALQWEYQYVVDHLEEYPHYSILQLFRLIYTYETGDVVVSKSQASNWAIQTFPELQQHIEIARKAYAGNATASDKKFMLQNIRDLLELSILRIEHARKKRLEFN